jgi:hypothetical protein
MIDRLPRVLLRVEGAAVYPTRFDDTHLQRV